jgi:glyoxylase-like metal-dependent hydrolase (beta-lactamase superfamily II)
MVADGVYAAIVKRGTGAWGNAGIVDLGKITVVFDTFFTPDAAHSLRSAAEEITGCSPTYVINSHWHEDHVFGNQVFDDAIIIATNTTAELMHGQLDQTIEEERASPSHIDPATIQQEHDPRLRRELEVLAGDYQAASNALPTLRLRLPDITFEKRLTIHGQQRSAELITLGGGHTPSDMFLYLPDLATALTGDLVQVAFHPSMNTGNLATWITILDHLTTLHLQHIIPGHGNAGTGEHVEIMRQYLYDLQHIVSQGREQGLTEAQIIDSTEPEKYTSWSAAPIFKQNLRRIFQGFK